MIRINLSLKEGVSEQIKRVFSSITQFWNNYDVFSYISIILGIFISFSRIISGGPPGSLSIIGFFSWDWITALISVLYVSGLCFIFIHFFKSIRHYVGASEKAIKRHSNSYIYLSIFLFTLCTISIYIYFILLPPSFSQGEICIWFDPEWRCHHYPPSFEVALGFNLISVQIGFMISGVIYGKIYDRIVLLELYNTYLPTYLPRKRWGLDEFDEKQSAN